MSNDPYENLYQDFESSDGMVRYVQAKTTEKKPEKENETFSQERR